MTLRNTDIYSYHGEEILERDETPLRLPLLFILQRRGELLCKRGVSLSFFFFPLPLLREGGQGDRLLNDLNKGDRLLNNLNINLV